MRGWFYQAVFSNLVLKVVSLGMAVLFFVVVHSEKQSLAQGTVSVSYVVPSGKVLVTRPPANLRIGVVGPVSRLQRFHIDELASVNVDLSAASDGYFKFREDLLPLPTGLKVSFIRPDGFHLRFEPTYRRALPVHVELEGEPSPGFHVTGRAAKPPRVTISGPRRLVLAIGSLRTEPVSIDGATSTVTERAAIVPPPGIQETEPTTVEAVVTVAAVLGQSVIKVPVLLQDAAGRTGQLSVRTVTVRVEGQPDALASLRPESLRARVRTSTGQSGRVEVRPTIEGLPAGVHVLRVQPVHLEVRLGAARRGERGGRSP